jgi:competence protein ComEC
MNPPDKFLITILVLEAGIFLASFFSFANIFLLIFLSLILIVFPWILFFKKELIFFLFLFFVFVFGIGYFQIFEYFFFQNSSAYLNGKEISSLGMVYQEKEEKEYSDWLRVKLLGEYQGRVLVKVEKNGNIFNYGDIVLIKGKIEEPENFSDFNFKSYLLKERIYSVINYPEIEFKEKYQGFSLKFCLLKVKNFFQDRINSVFLEPESSFLSGLLLGTKNNLSANFKENLNRSGTSHLVALSGYNITIISSFVLSVLLFFGLSRGKAFWFSVLFISLFVLLTGASASVVRAGIMGLLFLLSQKLGYIYNPRNSLFFAGAIMTLFNPRILYFDIGFQLSFVATLGLIYFYPFFEKIFQSKKNSFLNWKETFSLTISAQISVLPLIILYFGYFSFVSPLSNIVILLFIPLSMFLGFLSVFLSLFIPLLGNILGAFTHLILKFEIMMINFFGGMKIAGIDLGKYQEIFFYFSLIFLILFVLFVYTKRKKLNYG